MPRSRWICRLLLALICLFALICPAQMTMSEAASDYLTYALDLMQANSIHRYDLDWERIRDVAFRRALTAQTPAGTHTALEGALRMLQDNHSRLLKPAELAARIARPIEEVPMPSGEMATSAIALLRVPAFTGTQSQSIQFAARLHAATRALQDGGAQGWIVDLRGNTGGNMWPMLAGIGPVLGHGTAGAFVDPDDDAIEWSYWSGAAYSADTPNLRVPSEHVTQPLSPSPAVAVLIDARVFSSGEAIAVSFKGRENTRFFGEPTGGLTTSNRSFELSDGALLILTTATFADRTGTRYGGPVVPDVVTSSEAALDAAIDWLTEQISARESDVP